MSTVAANQEFPPTDLPEEDGVPLESDWHRLEMNLLVDLVTLHLGDREDYFVGGNMFIYFDPRQARGWNFRGPDFFLAWNRPLNPPRRYWAVWDEEGKYPDIIIELTSPSTADEDYGAKKRIYERTFHTSEYFVYDPDEQELLGWRLDRRSRYQAIVPGDNGWLWSEQLGLWLGKWNGVYLKKKEVYLRFFDKDGKLVVHDSEQIKAERQRAASEKRRADAEKRRADAAEAELRRLKKSGKKP